MPDVSASPDFFVTASTITSTPYENMSGSSYKTAESSVGTSFGLTPIMQKLRSTIRPMPVLDESEENTYMEFNPGNESEIELSFPTSDSSALFGRTFIVKSRATTLSKDMEGPEPASPFHPERLSLQLAHEALQRTQELDDDSLSSVFDEIVGIADQLKAIKERMENQNRQGSTSGVSTGDDSIGSIPGKTSKKILEWERMSGETPPAVPPKKKNLNITVGPPGHTPAARPVNLSRTVIKDSLSDLSVTSAGSSPRTVRVRFGGVEEEEEESDKKETGARPKTYRI